MLSKVSIIVSLATLCLYLYGVLILITENEENLCKMTYMYEYPQFVKISVKENTKYPKYNLYAYSEGHLTENARNSIFTGAPVLFIPGNSGSHKQARSFASVALRKGIDRGYTQHLDFFTVDLNEEYSALFGGVLNEQTEFVELCVTRILNLYKNLLNPPSSLIVIGHSMGGKIAQALLISDKVRTQINTIINLATPMDRPVISIDFHIEGFYKKIENFWSANRNVFEVTNQTNFCENKGSSLLKLKNRNDESKKLDEKLLITIGGGSRDLHVHSGLTTSKYSDIHAMTSTIPNVWLSTDHLCTVWCLQLVLVVNRFLFSILRPQQGGHASGLNFIKDKNDRLQKANYFFRKNPIFVKNEEIDLVTPGLDPGDWIESSKRTFTERFTHGINRTHVQMIRLVDAPQYKMLYAEVINLETSNWIFGCAANVMTDNIRFCAKGTSITSRYMKKIPSIRHERNIIRIDLHELKKQNPDWSHVILRFLPTSEPFQLNIDVHSPGDREVNVIMPKWYSFSSVTVMEETLLGVSVCNIRIKGLESSHQALELSVKPKSCSLNQYHSVGKLCIPWIDGFNSYHFFTESKRKPFDISAPTHRPASYNTTNNPLTVELSLDPSCRYTIAVKNSLGTMMSRVVLQFSHWMFAHFVAILLLAFKHQISLTPNNEPFRCGTLHSALVKSSSFFIITASRVFVKLILWTKFLPNPDEYHLPISISIVIHGACLAILTFATGALWTLVTFFGNVAHKILFKLIKLPIPTISGILVPFIQRFPITIAVLLISISLASCGAVSLVLAVTVYFILLTKMYEDYLEEFVFKTAKLIAQKLFGKNKNDNDDGTEDEKLKMTDADIVEGQDDDGGKNQEDDKKEGEKKKEQILESIETEEDEELERLLQETLERQKKQQEERVAQEQAVRVEYDSIISGLSKINFHLPLFFLLVILTILNFPSAITWAKNYQYATLLKPDPSAIPTLITLVSLAALWQLPSPRTIAGYRIVSSVLYMSALICILYCQDSVFRLNAVISSVFLVTALHQICGRRFVKIDPDILDEDEDVRDRVHKLRAALQQAHAEELLNTAENGVNAEGIDSQPLIGKEDQVDVDESNVDQANDNVKKC